jgi:hypothetical protein
MAKNNHEIGIWTNPLMPATGHRPQAKTYTNALLSNMYYERFIAMKLRSHALILVIVAVLAFSAYH